MPDATMELSFFDVTPGAEHGSVTEYALLTALDTSTS